MTTLHVTRVFVGDTAADGRAAGGNHLGVFLDGPAVPESRRQPIAADLGYAETVFVDDRTIAGGDGDPADTAMSDQRRAISRVRIFTPTTELPFAGHPLVGTSWLLASTGDAVDVLRTRAGDVPTWSDGALTWIRGRPEWSPEFELRQYPTPAAIDALSPGEFADDVLVDAWAWIDEAAGEIRCRVFPHDVGIAEDEATGSAAVRLGGALGRPLLLRQGVGSVLHVRPGAEPGTVEVGGVTVMEETRDYDV